MDSGRPPVKSEAGVYPAGMTSVEESGVHDLETRHCIIPAALAVLRTPDAASFPALCTLDVASPLRRHSGGHATTQARNRQSAGIHWHVHFARVGLEKTFVLTEYSRHRQSPWIPADCP